MLCIEYASLLMYVILNRQGLRSRIGVYGLEDGKLDGERGY